jgi:hypothetical protein
MSMFKIGDIVVFGRPNGEQTRGRVLRVNAATLTIEQLEARGQTRAREAGTKWRVHPSLVKLESATETAPAAPKAKRSEAEILADLRRVNLRLEPEYLYLDGERSRSAAHALEAKLNAERKALVKELGREPTPFEIWGV